MIRIRPECTLKGDFGSTLHADLRGERGQLKLHPEIHEKEVSDRYKLFQLEAAAKTRHAPHKRKT